MMDLYTALQQVEKRLKIRRLSWEDGEVYCCLEEGILSIHNEDTIDAWIISTSDLAAHDWIVFEEEYEDEIPTD